MMRALAITVILMTACASPLRVESKNGTATIDVQKNGEPSEISSILLFNSETAQPVWQLVSDRSDRYLLRTLQLRAGLNPAAPPVFGGKARAMFPHDATTFVLQPGVLYRVHACAPVAYGGCTSREFSL